MQVRHRLPAASWLLSSGRTCAHRVLHSQHRIARFVELPVSVNVCATPQARSPAFGRFQRAMPSWWRALHTRVT
jgi:hypothetical protein